MRTLLLSTLLFFTILGCNSKSSQETLDRNHLLVTNTLEGIVSPKAQAFHAQVLDLQNEVEKACRTEARTKDLKEKWQAAMMTYHYLEAMAFGPLKEEVKDGGDLALHIYAWDESAVLSPVYSQMRRAHNRPNYKFKKRRVKFKGLYALELMLFDKFADQKFITAEDEACPYMDMVAKDLSGRSQYLLDRLQRNYVDFFRDPKNQLHYDSFIGEMVKELQFVYKVVQSKKLAPLLGEKSHADLAACEGNVENHKCIEHRFSGLTQEALAENFRALDDIFTGAGGFGFIGYLQLSGRNAEAEKIQSLLQLVVRPWKSVSEGSSFTEKVKNYEKDNCSQDILCVTFQNIVGLATWIKGDFPLLMSEELPEPVQGDND